VADGIAVAVGSGAVVGGIAVASTTAVGSAGTGVAVGAGPQPANSAAQRRIRTSETKRERDIVALQTV